MVEAPLVVVEHVQLGPVTEFAVAAPTMAAPTHVVVYIPPAPAVTYAASASAVEYVVLHLQL